MGNFSEFIVLRINSETRCVLETTRRVLQIEETLKDQGNDLHEIEKKLKLAETELKFAEETRMELNLKVDIFLSKLINENLCTSKMCSQQLLYLL